MVSVFLILYLFCSSLTVVALLDFSSFTSSQWFYSSCKYIYHYHNILAVTTRICQTRNYHWKLFYAKKASEGSPVVLTNNVTSLSRLVSALDKYTEYEFQVLAFSSKGDGPKSSVVVERTKEDGKLILVKDSTCIIIFGKKLKMHFSGQSTIPTISITTYVLL